MLGETEDILYQGDNGWKILIHDRRQTPLIDVRTHGSSLNNGWGKDIRIYIRQVSSAGSTNNPINIRFQFDDVRRSKAIIFFCLKTDKC